MATRFFLQLIFFYQKYLRQLLPCSCRFTPTCSEYAVSSLEKYGLLRGAAKALKRLGCCHPFSGKSGYDPLI